MSYFNEYQQDYMRELAALPPEAKCRCGWYRRGTCPHCFTDEGGKSERCGRDIGDGFVCVLRKGHMSGCCGQRAITTAAGGQA